MKCPNDGSVLTMADRQGIEIDYCPQCRGIWLDRGELDKLIERSNGASQGSRETYREPSYDKPRQSNDGYYKKRKKESFLGDLFDF